jgi:hypothetical protein
MSAFVNVAMIYLNKETVAAQLGNSKRVCDVGGRLRMKRHAIHINKTPFGVFTPIQE